MAFWAVAPVPSVWSGMALVSLEAVVAFPYAGREVAAGGRFMAEAEDARILTALGRAKHVPDTRHQPLDDAHLSQPEPPVRTRSTRRTRRQDVIDSERQDLSSDDR